MAVRRVKDAYGSVTVQLVECPSCGADLNDGEPSAHLRGHNPEDFGLSPSEGDSS